MADTAVVKKCPHGKRKNDCVECGGSSICEHKKRKFNCKECGGGAYCVHGKRKENCIECCATNFCIHKKRKNKCAECDGSYLCIHKKYKNSCVECKGSLICIHEKRKNDCVICSGSSICPHKKRKFNCKECGGGNFCTHGKAKSRCKECGGSAYCPHDKIKFNCRECGGGGFCKHDKLKTRCKECGGVSLCKSEWCHTISNKNNDGYCLLCFIHLFPDKKTSRNYKTKEIAIRDELITYFNNYQWICDKKILNGKSFRRPDILLELEKQILIIEIDENQHITYDCSCNNKRLMEISLDFEHKPIVFVRFNPDSYINKDNVKIKSCWKTGLDGIFRINEKYQKEWEERLNILKENIKYWLNNNTNKTIEVIELFYDQNIIKEIEI
jgi:hypothetical protein